MGMQPILPVTVSVKKIKGAARQRNIVTVGVDEPLTCNSATIFTARIPKEWGRYCFHRCLSVKIAGRGGLPSRMTGGGGGVCSGQVSIWVPPSPGRHSNKPSTCYAAGGVHTGLSCYRIRGKVMFSFCWKGLGRGNPDLVTPLRRPPARSGRAWLWWLLLLRKWEAVLFLT